MRFHASALAVLGLSAVLSHAAWAWKTAASDEAAEVEKLDRDLSAAGVRGDVDTSSRLIADKAIFVDDVHESGKTRTKADLLAFMRSADYTPKSETFDDIHSKQFGDTVVLCQRSKSRSLASFGPAEPSGMLKTQMTGRGVGRDVSIDRARA
jgi:hypothetical protein